MTSPASVTLSPDARLPLLVVALGLAHQHKFSLSNYKKKWILIFNRF